MRIRLVAVPPGGGEADYSLDMDSPALPQVGDYITVLRHYAKGSPPEDYRGTEDFIVRRVRWTFKFPDDGKGFHEAGREPVGKIDEVVVECEMAIGTYSSPAHKRNAGDDAQTHEASAY